MHFRLPKPLHGWRAFIGEVAIIVLGVLIALGAEQVVQSIHARQNARDAEARVRGELIDDAPVEIERVALDSCLRQRLGDIAAGLSSGRKDWSPFIIAEQREMPTALREIYHMPSRNWVTDAYREALTQGDFQTLPAERRAEYADLYKQLDHLAELNQEEPQVATALAPLQFNPTLTGAERDGMLTAVARLDEMNRLIVLLSRQNLHYVHQLDPSVSRQDVLKSESGDMWADELAHSPQIRSLYGKCVDGNAAAAFDPALLNAAG